MMTTDPGISPPLAKAITESTRVGIESTIESICGDVPRLVERPQAKENVPEVVGIISFVGDKSWALSWGFGASAAVAVAHRFTGLELSFECSDIGEVISELVNVLAGAVVAQADMRGLKVQMSLPTVARGSSVEILSERSHPVGRMDFESSIGRFWVQMACVATSSQRMPGRAGLRA